MTDLVSRPDAPPATAAPTAGELRIRPLLLQMAAALVALTVVGAVVALLVEDQAQAIGRSFVESWGLWGVALAFFVPDSVAFPVPGDPFMLLALHGGMPFPAVVAAGSAGSIAGGCFAFLGTQAMRRIPAIGDYVASRAAGPTAIVERYGALALALGALTPLPYSVIAWACGLLGMPFRTFFLVSLLRIPRVALYAAAMWAFPMMWGG